MGWLPGCCSDPLHELPYEAVGVGELAVALTPWLGLRRSDDGGAGCGDAGEFGVDVFDDESDQHALAGRAGDGLRFERSEAGAQEDHVDPGVGVGQGHEAVVGHGLGETEVGFREFGRGVGVCDVQGQGGAGDLDGDLQDG